MDRASFETVFRKGQVISSGGPRSKLRIHEISDQWFSVVPIFGVHNSPMRMRFSQLAAVIDGFLEIDPKRIAPTIQPVLTSRGEKEERTTENYLYGFAREYLTHFSGSGESIPEEIEVPNLIFEGAKRQVVVNAYERHSGARAVCIANHGSVCCVCSFDFGKVYGSLGRGFIHVHHLKPLSSIGHEYELDPVKDLRPVCPNCHAMIHLRSEALSIEELQAHLKIARDANALPASTQPFG